MKLLLSFLLSISFLTANEKQKTDEELIAEFMQLEKQIKNKEKKQEEAKRKTREIKKLRKTVDELAKTLGVDKK